MDGSIRFFFLKKARDKERVKIHMLCSLLGLDGLKITIGAIFMTM